MGYKSYFTDNKQNSRVYEVTCNYGKKYIGMTQHWMLVRISEHEKDADTENPVFGLSKHLRSEHHAKESLSETVSRWIKFTNIVRRLIYEYG